MAIPQDNRHLLVEAGILAMLARAGRSGEVEIQREVIPRPGQGLFVCIISGAPYSATHVFNFGLKNDGVVSYEPLVTARFVNGKGWTKCATWVEEQGRRHAPHL